MLNTLLRTVKTLLASKLYKRGYESKVGQAMGIFVAQKAYYDKHMLLVYESHFT